MSERQAKARRRTEEDSPNGAAPKVVEGTPSGEDSMPHPAVLVMRVPGSNPGEETIQLGEFNGIDRLSIPTLLRKAAAIMEQNLGL